MSKKIKDGWYIAAPVIPLQTMARLSPVIIWSNSRDRAALARQIKAQA
jgi:hypothetical protein